MMKVIENLTSAPLSPPNLALVVTIQNIESHEEELKDDSSVESHVGDVMDSRPKLMNEDDERSNAVENNEGDISKDIVNVDTIDFPSRECYDPVNASTYVVVAELALLEGANKVADADNKHADNPFLFDTIKLFDNVDAVKTKHLVSPREPTLGIGSISHVPQIKYHHESWVWRINQGVKGTSQAHEAEGHGVSSPSNTVEAKGHHHSDMEFEEFEIPTSENVGKAGRSQAATSSKTILVQQNIVEILVEEELWDTRSKGKSPSPNAKEKTRKQVKKVATIHPSIIAKRQRVDSETINP
ncbi:unnamed protein product [Cuscuta campestris]|uniref:Uncharacterized protein n=1 Tax=Cuscuta campestris TaxID=132261 RepID=A0A484M5K9_9ASTE|nr:unnamed protein product [Cuscuta campestris]